MSVDPDRGDQPAAFVWRRRVAWADTDASGHHHFTAVLRWVEEAEIALLEASGVAGELGGRMPRVHVDVDYLDRVWFRDEVEVAMSVAAIGRSSVRFAFHVRCEGRDIARGEYVAVLVDRDGSAVAISDDVRERLGA